MPAILIPIIVYIGALAVRLTAYIIAEGWLLALLGNTLFIFSQTALLALESAVAVIEPYVFKALKAYAHNFYILKKSLKIYENRRGLKKY